MPGPVPVLLDSSVPSPVLTCAVVTCVCVIPNSSFSWHPCATVGCTPSSRPRSFDYYRGAGLSAYCSLLRPRDAGITGSKSAGSRVKRLCVHV